MRTAATSSARSDRMCGGGGTGAGHRDPELDPAYSTAVTPYPATSPATRRNAPRGDRACTSGRAVLPAPGILTPHKDHHQGRAQGHVACGDGASATLDTDLPRQEPAPIAEDARSSTRLFCRIR